MTDKGSKLEVIAGEIANCQGCDLSKTRTHPVPGEGNPDAKLVLVGEGPGAQEDAKGRPFVGRSGKLLDEIISANGVFTREDLFITNVVKCRPPENRTPLPHEIAACSHHLIGQLDTLRPKAVLCLGSTASQMLTGQQIAIGRLRGRNLAGLKPAIIVTYHPSYGLRMGEPIVKLMASDYALAANFALGNDHV